MSSRFSRAAAAALALAALAAFPSTGVADRADAPLEIDILEEYLATADWAPATPHCARTHGAVMVPGRGPVAVPVKGTNALMDEHLAFHVQMGDGPADFAPSPDDADRYGEIFLEWHEYFVGMYQRWRAEHGHPPLTGWDPATPMPPALAYPYPERACAEGRNTDPRVPLPSWATLEGGDEKDPIFGYTRLCDFRDANEFGKSIAGDWHRGFHVGVGGEMRAMHGPRDPAFWAGHQFLIELTWTWETDCAGADASSRPAGAEAAVVERSVPGVPFGGVIAAIAAGVVAAAARARARS